MIAPSSALRPPSSSDQPAAPRMIRSSVDLPAPLAPMSADVVPSPTRNETSSSSGRPSASEYDTPLTSM